MRGESGVGRPRDARIDAAVLDAARELIGQVGYGRLTLTEVAARAGTSVPAIRRRWPSKLHLVHNVVFPTEVVLPPRKKNSTLDGELMMIIGGCIGVFADPAMSRAITGLISEAVGEGSMPQELTARFRSAVWADLADRLRETAAQEGIDISPDPDGIVEVLFGGALMALMLQGPDCFDDAWITRMHRVLRTIIGAPLQ